MSGIVVAAAALSLFLTDLVRRYAVAKGIVAIPNDRTLHSIPTPRGGGIGIAIVSLGTIVLLGLSDMIPANTAIGLFGGGAAVALVGWKDDKRHVSPLVRALIHFCAAAWAIYWLNGFYAIRLGVDVFRLGWLGSLLAVLAIVWFINLYNFMDGVDAIAATEAVFVSAVGGTILLVQGITGLGILSFTIGGAALGFLVRNWPPARIFMGDVASGLLGFLFGAIAIASEQSGGLPLLAWLILLGVFVLDATVTLVRRVARGERWYSAHRTHAYQRLVRAGWSHTRVAVGVALLNLLLAALAISVMVRPGLLLVAVATAAVILAVGYLRVERLMPLDAAQNQA